GTDRRHGGDLPDGMNERRTGLDRRGEELAALVDAMMAEPTEPSRPIGAVHFGPTTAPPPPAAFDLTPAKDPVAELPDVEVTVHRKESVIERAATPSVGTSGVKAKKSSEKKGRRRLGKRGATAESSTREDRALLPIGSLEPSMPDVPGNEGQD